MRSAEVYLFALLVLLTPRNVFAQTPEHLPFAPGEEFVFEIRSSRLGDVGHGRLGACGPDTLRGHEVYVLYFDLHTKVALVTVEDRRRSWLDPIRLSSLRYYKYKKNPLSTRADKVELWPEQGRWESEDGAAGTLPNDSPLDELSFIYLLRTLPLKNGEALDIERHFNPKRNPVTVRSLGHEILQTDLGEMSTLVVEMRVRDTEYFEGEGVLRFNFTDDKWRLPIRIKSSAPLAGELTLDMVHYSPPRASPHTVPCPEF